MRKKINKIIKTLVITTAMLMLASCVTSRRVNYLQDMTHGSQIEIENRFEATIAPYDELSINVTSSNATETELAAPFSLGAENGFLVDVDGDIEMPTLGKLHVAGMTRMRLQDTLTYLLRQGGYLKDPYVNVRFKNFKIFFLGGGKGQVLTITNERCTFLEALAMLGDIDIYTRRDHIAVMREVNGHMVMRYLDPRSSDIFNDPFFMLQQNDFIITQTLNSGTLRSEVGYWTGIASGLLSLASLVTSIVLYRAMIKNQ